MLTWLAPESIKAWPLTAHFYFVGTGSAVYHVLYAHTRQVLGMTSVLMHNSLHASVNSDWCDYSVSSKLCDYLQDVFSAGCVLAEMFLDGKLLFDRPQVLPLPAPLICTIHLCLSSSQLSKLCSMQAQCHHMPSKNRLPVSGTDLLVKAVCCLSTQNLQYYFVAA